MHLVKLAVLLISLFCVQLCVAQTQAQLDDVSSQLKSSKKVRKTNISKRQTTQSSINSLEKKIAERDIRHEQTLLKQKTLQKIASDLALQTNTLSQQYEGALKRLSTLLESAYMMGRQHGLKVILSGQGPEHIARLNNYARDISEARLTQLNMLSTLRKQINKKLAELKIQRTQINKLALVLAEDKRTLAQLKENRLLMMHELTQVIDAGTLKINELSKRKARLTKLLTNISQRQKTRRIQTDKANKRDQLTRNPELTKSKPAPMHKGQLPLPAKARIIAKFGDRRAVSDLPWSGILMQAKEGTTIRAISAGEVVYADWLKGFGQMIIIDHGNQIMSLYAHNKRIDKVAGEHVQQSDMIATMGDTAGLKKAALYFEIRQDGQAQDPLLWCRL